MQLDFLDEANILVKGGKGGDGAISFRREKYVPKGGPDGGDGGNGGSVIIRATPNKTTLLEFKYKRKYFAEDGENGKAKNMYGKAGENLIIDVPLGTMIFNSETNDLLTDLKNPGDYYIAARGGKGGRGNSKFANSTLQAPRISENGADGEFNRLHLELKLVADIGIIGYPNVGKSTLISRISKAKPKIANYHFTTLTPNLGVVKVDEAKSFVVADIPGLIEGAHEGTGLGDQFLKHIERCYGILHLVDISGVEGRDPIEDYKKIREELEKYSTTLAEKDEIIAGNKIDIITEEELEKNIQNFERELDIEITPISAYSNKNLDAIIMKMWNMIKDYKEDELKNIEKIKRTYEDFKKLKVEPVVNEVYEYFNIEVTKISDHEYEIHSEGIDLLLKKYDISETDSRRKILNILERNGLSRTLGKAGVEEGDTIYIADYAFDYIP
ncbi:GTPase ObgE [Geotoga petraea]|uniref:GTPase Obg n=1 Tax=Geotoga petraea TaxID=28234 RepID=A0A1G6N3X2_9BACT|nr:GTPase ObgE [Geotoga petraea]SDC62523.1 GTP-binding protein [Geotoga petraea]